MTFMFAKSMTVFHTVSRFGFQPASIKGLTECCQDFPSGRFFYLFSSVRETTETRQIPGGLNVSALVMLTWILGGLKTFFVQSFFLNVPEEASSISKKCYWLTEITFSGNRMHLNWILKCHIKRNSTELLVKFYMCGMHVTMNRSIGPCK